MNGCQVHYILNVKYSLNHILPVIIGIAIVGSLFLGLDSIAKRYFNSKEANKMLPISYCFLNASRYLLIKHKNTIVYCIGTYTCYTYVLYESTVGVLVCYTK